jgi:hypothetical protein
MIVKLMWPAQEHGRTMDAFWVECTPEEITAAILPLLSTDQRTELAALQEREETSTSHFLIARDLSTIQPMDAIYPFSNLWNAYNPFCAIPDAFIATLEAIKTLTVNPDADPTIGPQYAADAPFARRMRFHQSWYRAHVLKRHYGLGPSLHSTKPYGNMLKRDDGAWGDNFLTPAIFMVAKQYLEHHTGLIEGFRLRNNMLSSQPMVFNLFGPLVGDPARATRLLHALMPAEIAKVIAVSLEYAPQPKAKYLNDNTAFDAFVRYERPDGAQGFLGIEAKLTEPFSQKLYDTPQYRAWTTRPGSPWPEHSWGDVANLAHNQLWRDHLLAEALRHDPKEAFAVGRLMLVRHPKDTDCAAVVAGYQALLKPNDDTFVDMPLDRLVNAWRPLLNDDEEHAWLNAFHLRYLDLSASEAAWQAQLPQAKPPTQ